MWSLHYHLSAEPAPAEHIHFSTGGLLRYLVRSRAVQNSLELLPAEACVSLRAMSETGAGSRPRQSLRVAELTGVSLGTDVLCRRVVQTPLSYKLLQIKELHPKIM